MTMLTKRTQRTQYLQNCCEQGRTVPVKKQSHAIKSSREVKKEKDSELPPGQLEGLATFTGANQGKRGPMWTAKVWSEYMDG